MCLYPSCILFVIKHRAVSKVFNKAKTKTKTKLSEQLSKEISRWSTSWLLLGFRLCVLRPHFLHSIVLETDRIPDKKTQRFFTRSYLIFLISLYWDSGTITSGKSLEDDLKQTPMVRTYDTKFPNPSVLTGFDNSGSFGRRWNLIGLPLESFTKTQAGTAVTFHCGL
uniref:Uncharacterized protein n=1 Tax=Clytia hemisphaerica TaxID=252671 RepID=A0A7M5X7N4_9CNID